MAAAVFVLPLTTGCVSRVQGQDFLMTELARLTGSAIAFAFNFIAQSVNPFGNV